MFPVHILTNSSTGHAAQGPQSILLSFQLETFWKPLVACKQCKATALPLYTSIGEPIYQTVHNCALLCTTIINVTLCVRYY